MPTLAELNKGVTDKKTDGGKLSLAELNSKSTNPSVVGSQQIDPTAGTPAPINVADVLTAPKQPELQPSPLTVQNQSAVQQPVQITQPVNDQEQIAQQSNLSGEYKVAGTDITVGGAGESVPVQQTFKQHLKNTADDNLSQLTSTASILDKLVTPDFEPAVNSLQQAEKIPMIGSGITSDVKKKVLDASIPLSTSLVYDGLNYLKATGDDSYSRLYNKFLSKSGTPESLTNSERLQLEQLGYKNTSVVLGNKFNDLNKLVTPKLQHLDNLLGRVEDAGNSIPKEASSLVDKYSSLVDEVNLLSGKLDPKSVDQTNQSSVDAYNKLYYQYKQKYDEANAMKPNVDKIFDEYKLYSSLYEDYNSEKNKVNQDPDVVAFRKTYNDIKTIDNYGNLMMSRYPDVESSYYKQQQVNKEFTGFDMGANKDETGAQKAGRQAENFSKYLWYTGEKLLNSVADIGGEVAKTIGSDELIKSRFEIPDLINSSYTKDEKGEHVNPYAVAPNMIAMIPTLAAYYFGGEVLTPLAGAGELAYANTLRTIGTVGTQFALGYGEDYENSVNNYGLTKDQAQAYSFLTNTFKGLIFAKLIPAVHSVGSALTPAITDAALKDGAESISKSLIDGIEKKTALNIGFNTYKKAVVNQLISATGMSSLEIADKLAQKISDEGTGKNNFNPKLNLDELGTHWIGNALTFLPMGALDVNNEVKRSNDVNNYIRLSSAVNADFLKDEFISKLNSGEITQEQHDNAVKIIDESVLAYNNIPKDLDAPTKSELIPLLTRRIQLEGEPMKTAAIKKELNDIENNISEVLNNKEKSDATNGKTTGKDSFIVTKDDMTQLDKEGEFAGDNRKTILGQVRGIVKAIGDRAHVILHKTEDSYLQALNDAGYDAKEQVNTEGVFDENGNNGKGIIHINLSKSRGHTVFHEGAHQVLAPFLKANPDFAKQKYDDLKTAFNNIVDAGGEDAVHAKKMLDELNSFAGEYITDGKEDYKGATTEEPLVEFINRLATGRYNDIFEKPESKGIVTAIRDWVNGLLKILGEKLTGQKESKGEDGVQLNSADDVISFARKMSDAFNTGKEISIKPEEKLKEISEGNNGTEPITESPVEINPDVFKLKPSKSPDKIILSPEDLNGVKRVDLYEEFKRFEEKNGRPPRIWVWMADQLKRGEYHNEKSGVKHFLEGGFGWAVDPKHIADGDIWASGIKESSLADRIADADYIMLMSGSENSSFNFSKGTSKVLIKEIGVGLRNNIGKSIAGVRIDKSDVAKDADAFKKFIEISDKILSDTKNYPKKEGVKKDAWGDFLSAIKNPEMMEKISRKIFAQTLLHKGEGVKITKPFGKFMHEDLGLPTRDIFNSMMREDFLIKNNFTNGDIGLLLKPNGKIGSWERKHDTYYHTIKGEVIGVPTHKFNVLDILPKDKLREKRVEDASDSVKVKTLVGDFGTVYDKSKLNSLKAKKEDLISDTPKKRLMTEDDKGNYVFFHYGKQDLTKSGIDPNKFGTNALTSREEKQKSIPVSMYYTEPNIQESGTGNYKHIVRIPKKEVYPFNEDPLKLLPEARKQFEIKFPNRAFDLNNQIAWVSKLAAEKGYKMTVGDWGANSKGKVNSLRAETPVKLTPELAHKPIGLNSIKINDKVEDFKSNRNLKARKEEQTELNTTIHQSPDDLKSHRFLEKGNQTREIFSVDDVNSETAKYTWNDINKPEQKYETTLNRVRRGGKYFWSDAGTKKVIPPSVEALRDLRNKEDYFTEFKYPDVVFKDIKTDAESNVAIGFYKKIVDKFNKEFGRDVKINSKRDANGKFSVTVEYEDGLKPSYFAYPTAKIGEHKTISHINNDVPLTSLRHELIHEMLVKHITSKFERINKLDNSADAKTIEDVQRNRAYNYSLEDVFFERVVENIERKPDNKDTFGVETYGEDVTNRLSEEIKGEPTKENVLATLDVLLEGSNKWLADSLKDIFSKTDLSGVTDIKSLAGEIGKKFKQKFDTAKNIFPKSLFEKIKSFTETFNSEYKGVETRLEKQANKESVAAGKKLFNAPNPETKTIAEKYKKDNGLITDAGEKIYDLNIDSAKRIANAYEEMKHDPFNPEVKKAYTKLSEETKKQYEAVINSGYKLEIYDGEGEPYKNSQEMIDDLKNNKHLFIFGTEGGFGTEKITDAQREENPLLYDSGYKDINGKPLLMNDLFRGVHDFFGHSERGNSFGAKGEENAWDVHSRMFTPEARRAMTTETRGQNSWVNFGEHNFNEDGSKKDISAKDKPFAEQKIGLLPEEFSRLNSETTSESLLSKEQTPTALRDGDVKLTKNKVSFNVGGDEYNGVEIQKNGESVGAIAYNKENNEIEGIKINTKNRRQGVAKNAIKKLFSDNPKIDDVYVRATPQAKKFWQSVGIDFSAPRSYNEDAGLWEGFLSRESVEQSLLSKEQTLEADNSLSDNERKDLNIVPEDNLRARKESLGDPEFDILKDDYLGSIDRDHYQAGVQALKLQKEIQAATGVYDKENFDRKWKTVDKAIQIYIDLKTHPEHHDMYYDKLTDGQKKIVDMSQNLTPEQQAVADKIAAEYESMKQGLTDAGILHSTQENYVSRAWDFENTAATDANKKFVTSSRHTKQRTLGSILEGWAEGYKLKIEGATNNLATYKKEMANVLAARQLIDSGSKVKIGEEGNEHPLFSTYSRDGYKRIENRYFTKWNRVGKVDPITKEGDIAEDIRMQMNGGGKGVFVAEDGTVFQRLEVYAPDSIAKRLNNILGESALKGNGVADALSKAVGFVKNTMLFTSFFHHQAFIRNHLLSGNFNSAAELSPRVAYKKGLKLLESGNPQMVELIKAGLTIKPNLDYEENLNADKKKHIEKLDKHGFEIEQKNVLVKMYESQHRFLFEKFGAGLKAINSMNMYTNELRKHPEKDPNEIAKIVAAFQNENFGGLHLQRIERNPTKQHFMRLLMLAPDWTESNLRMARKAFKGGYEGKFYRAMWGKVFLRAAVASVATNLAMALMPDTNDPNKAGLIDRVASRYKRAWDEGHLNWTKLNISPLAHMFGANPKNDYYFSIFGHYTDPVRLGTAVAADVSGSSDRSETIGFFFNKGSILTNTGLKVITGKDWKGDDFTTFMEFMGLDDKGNYKENTHNKRTGVTHEAGSPKGGQLAGKLTKFSIGSTPFLKPNQFVTAAMEDSRSMLPLQIQGILQYAQGESDGVTLTSNMIGAGVTPASIKRKSGFDPLKLLGITKDEQSTTPTENGKTINGQSMGGQSLNGQSVGGEPLK